MKVGTDGVLLGAWSPTDHNPQTILDIGSGTGLIALMLAQRTNAHQIDAVELDDDAYEQSVNNFENSSWSDRLFCYHAGIEEFAEEMKNEETYELIVSNPPFYSENYTTGNEKRNKARFTSSMPFKELIESAATLLCEHKGIFAVILPFKEENNFIKIADTFSLYPYKITRVKGTPESELKRSLIAFKKQKADNISLDKLIIEIKRHQYTPDYIALTRDFYLNLR